MSGADLANLVNEAALFAARGNKRVVDMDDFEKAKDKIFMGPERRSMVMSEDEKRATAYHESGHAVVARLLPGTDPVHKVTIVPRGRALGVTMSLPERDRLSYSKKFFEARIAVCFGGRVAEQIIYGEDHLNSGASNDIMQATNMAKKMVTEFGFSEKLGPLRYTDNQEEVFLGHSVTQQKNMSDNTAMLIDAEVRRFVEDGERKARQILTEHKDELEAITRGLLEYETLSREDIDTLLRGEPLVRDGGYAKASDTPRRSSVPTSGPVGGDAEPQPGQ